METSGDLDMEFSEYFSALNFSDGADDDSDLAAAVLRRLESSSRDEDHRLCAAVGAMSQSLKDQSIPLTPVSYFAATAASLDRQSLDPVAASDPVTASLLTFLSLTIPSVPIAVIRSKGVSVCESVVRILRFGSISDGGVRAGLRCVTRLIVAGDKSNWLNLSPFYGVVLDFATDHRSKVRRQSHICLHEILQNFQRLTVLILASESITSTFERFLLLAGGSNPTNNTNTESNQKQEEKPKGGAMEVLYILSSLKDCLPLMAPKSTNIILKYFKTLLDLHQPLLTRGILEILQALCRSPTLGVNPEILLDLLCSLGFSVSSEGKTGDEMASIARLLHIGIKKVYDLNKEISVVRLPLVFSALGDILATEHEEAIFAAFEALKCLIDSCIDESLIEQGVTRIKSRNQGLKSGPTVIEKICALLEGFLEIRYNAVWDLSFQILSVAFDHLGESSRYLMGDALRSLAEMQSLPDEDFSFRKQLHECVGSVVAAMGPRELLNILNIQTLSDENCWILPVLKQHIFGASLSFFRTDILTMISGIQKDVQKLVNEDRLFSAKRAEGYIYSLWSLLPSFCNYPPDTASSFKDLQNVLCEKLCNEPDLHGIICSCLQILIQQNKTIISKTEQDDTESEEELSKSQRRAKGIYTRELAEENIKAIRACSSKFLKVFRTLFLESPKENSGCLQLTIREFASIADKKVVSKAFSSSIKELLDLTQKALDNNLNQPDNSNAMEIDHQPNTGNERRALLLDFSASLIPGLDAKEIDVLFRAVKPAILDKDGTIQKKAYKILSVILKDCDEFTERNLDILLELMVASLPANQFQSKRYRLECLYYLIVYISRDSFEQRKREVVGSFLTEILLALKEANKKTRNRAYDLLVEIGRACEEGKDERGNENLFQLFNMVAGGLVSGETPHMVSAAAKGLARLTYEFSDLLSVAYNLLPSAFLLLQRKNREIAKANLGFIKVLVAKSKAEGLQAHLRGLVEGLLKWQNDTKNHFKAKVKLLIEMLVRKCGLDAVKEVMPEEHMKLLTNIRKIKERKERKAKSLDGSESLASKTSLSRKSGWDHTRIFSDFGDSDADNDSDTEFGVSKSKSSHHVSRAFSSRSIRKRHASAKVLSEDLSDQSDGDPLDLLDRQTAISALHSSAHNKRKKPTPYSDEPEIDPEGRLIIREHGNKRKKKSDLTPDAHDSDSKSFVSRSKFSNASKRRKQETESGWAYTGKEYTSKKAGGDVKKKDKLEPYAYWPLDRKLLNRRSEHKAVARKGMARVMKKVSKRLEGKSVSSALSVKGVKIGKKHKRSNKSR